jgi:hypothetical protein
MGMFVRILFEAHFTFYRFIYLSISFGVTALSFTSP